MNSVLQLLRNAPAFLDELRSSTSTTDTLAPVGTSIVHLFSDAERLENEITQGERKQRLVTATKAIKEVLR